MAAPEDKKRLLAWYQALKPLHVDIIGDFAGKELFAIHGEALLFHCISEADIGYKNGFQILHAIHAVETFLSKLRERGCRFHILWFESLEELCIPTGSSDAASGCHRLTRAILVKHLQHSAAKGITFEFPSLGSEAFLGYTQKHSLRFFLCLDGFLVDEDESLFARQHLAFIHRLGSRGYSVALLNNFEFKSSKAFASMLPPFASDEKFEFFESLPLPKRNIIGIEELERNYGINSERWTPWNEHVPLSPRDIVSLTCVCNVLMNKSDDSMALCVASYIFHLLELRNSNVSQRPCSVVSIGHDEEKILDDFFIAFADIGVSVVNGLQIQDSWDVFDLLDSRILRQMFSKLAVLSVTSTVIIEAKKIAARVHQLTGVNVARFFPQMPDRGSTQTAKVSTPFSNTLTSVMPFNQLAVDDYLKSVHVVAEDLSAPVGISKVFRELSHWHNAKITVDPKALPRAPGFFARKRNQMLMADTIAYSASLTNSAGKIISPETVVTSVKDSPAVVKKKDKSRGEDNTSSKSTHHSQRSNQKKGSAKSGKERAYEEAQKIQQAKLDSKSRDTIAFWDERCAEFQAEANWDSRLANATAYFASLSRDGRSLIGAEVLLYVCHILASKLRDDSEQNEDAYKNVLFAKLWSVLLEAQKLPQSEMSFCLLEKFANAIGLSAEATLSKSQVLVDRKLPFPSTHIASLRLPSKSLEFQLEHCGPFLERSVETVPDPRVPNFIPDAWQRRVLDAIDADKSLFVVAPTSAGKTFISFYAMKQVLKSSDDGVLVYVAPTKALVNQIAAEIQARFSKSYRHDGRSVWAIHTRDYRINNPTGCQVLVTVPHILQIMLLAPSNAETRNSWSSRVKRIILDEIHCIGQAEDGVIWEQLLLLAPCPFIALSATVGNPLEFMQWLEASEKVKGQEMEMITHSARYSDLRKLIYRAPKESFVFQGFLPIESVRPAGLDEGPAGGEGSFQFIHPIASITNRNRGTIDDIALEPRDCMTLWKCMLKHHNRDYPIDTMLSPEMFLPKIVKRSNVLEWGQSLKQALQPWIRDLKSPFSAVQKELGSSLQSRYRKIAPESDLKSQFDFQITFAVREEKHQLATQALPLLSDLHARGALPGILFNYDRDFCEKTVKYVLRQLEQAEDAWKESSKEWTKKLSEYNAWKKSRSEGKPPNQNTKERPSLKGEHDSENMSKIDMLRDSAVEVSKWDSFDPDAPLDRFSFADGKKIAESELDKLIERIKHANVNPEIVKALKRGIAVHHAGMNRQYRQIVEMLFRKGYLRVVVATGTLALGINMPCKTVVFFGDSVFLTALNYHQGSGRAGRRGFDLLGNVVFAGIPVNRALQIMSSSLPDLSGHFPLSTTLVLRLLGLLHHTKNSEYSTKAMQSLLSLSRLYLGGPSHQMAIQHHLRFSIEYLRRQHLLSGDGTPLNFAGLVGHLYFTENAVFAFHSLLKDGFFHRVCKSVDQNPEAVLLELVLVLSHLFCRVPLGKYSFFINGHKSPSVIRLPPLSGEASAILQAHNQETLDIFRLYVSTYIEQHLGQTPDTKLPFTGYEVTSPKNCDHGNQLILDHFPPTRLRSPFAALSGFTDDFKSIHELCTTVRSDVFIEESAVPYIPIYPIDTFARPWNAYIYDFFKHGDLTALVRDNMIKRGDVWFRLKDFSLILSAIITSLENFLRLDGNEGDTAMMNLQDVGDAMEDADTESFDGQPHALNAAKKAPTAQATAPSASGAAHKKKVELDSWEDDVSDDDDDGTSMSSVLPSSDDESWNDDGDGNLKQVLRAFCLLREEFETKFKKVWA
ncbi:hypothetical protein NLG97_g5275 [Lecanicillium saksenae]|uniref:Uncharacterized protein n=1 Tax=Lecanicillium saksenae TaxID=468837 RepID=A0ACC1QW51_9HYPO|nr:hypothetical protein NLG97_g5275 [Lecanicillium saksenae]